MNVSRVVIAGLYGEGGKTTVATGVMAALVRKGLNVQPFKSGPDHIDATYHNQVTKKPSRHLDAWLTSQRTVLESFQRSAKNVDVAVIEGAGGIFQGIPRIIDGVKDFEGTAHIARILKAPIVLVLDIGSLWMHIWVYVCGGRKGVGQTIKSMAYGYVPTFLFGWIPFVGVIFSIWTLAVQIIGFRQLHEISTGRAVLAYLLGAIIIPGIIVVATFAALIGFLLGFVPPTPT